MCELLNSSDFEMHSRNQDLNLKFLRNDLKGNDCLENPLLKMEDSIHLNLMKHLLLKMQTDIRLRLKTNPLKFDKTPVFKNAN